MRALLLLLLALPTLATVIRVPQDIPGIQTAMDASAPGDTVRVDRGVWSGLLQSPVHTLTLCSNYLFTQDSTDINETILDGQLAGTILTVNTSGEALLTVTGFTMSRGMSFDAGWAYCGTGGAIRMEGDVNAFFTNIVFSHNHAEYGAAVIHHGIVCSVGQATGELTLRQVYCVDNTTDHPNSRASGFLIIRPRESRLIIDGFRFDCGGTDLRVMDVVTGPMDSVVLANVQVFNSSSSLIDFLPGTRNRNGIVLENIKLVDRFS